MSLYCPDGERADIPPRAPMPVLARGESRPPDPERDRCVRCRRLAWQHRSHPPLLADEIDRAIYAAEFVAAMRDIRTVRSNPSEDAQTAVALAEGMVELHRRARRP